MRAYVWTDEALRRHAGRFVWLSLDMEKASNAGTRRKLGIDAFPTFYVLDPADEHVAIRWLGGASIAQLERLFDDGELAVRGGSHGALLDSLVAADRAYGDERYADAARGYLATIALSPADWPAYGRVVESALFALSQSDSSPATLRLADAAWPRLAHTMSAVTVAGSGLDAAAALPDGDPGKAGRIATYEARCRQVLGDTSLPLQGDDRSGLYFSLEGAREALHDSTGERAVEEEHIAMLEREAAAAKTPEQRAVYDSHRTSLYVALGRPEQAIPMLEQSRRELPGDYNPDARLAIAYQAMKRWSDALAASDRAIARVYGPRQFLVLQTRADIFLGMSDTTRARATLTDALAKARAMPEGQRSQATIRAFEKRLAALAAR